MNLQARIVDRKSHFYSHDSYVHGAPRGAQDVFSQRTIHEATEIKDGTVWITPLTGLVRFDGVRFKLAIRATINGLVATWLSVF